MKDALSISPLRPVSPGLDFEGLKARGIALLQELSGDEWTDFNEHDPGVTTLEQICFALTELAYRAELPIDVLLSAPAYSAAAQHTALFPPEVMLPSPPVTERDDRKLLIDRVAGVGNAWFAPAAFSRNGMAPGLRTIELYLPADAADAADAAEDQARRAARLARLARRAYVRHRRLCEDIAGVHVVKSLTATLGASISIEAGTAPEPVLARVYYAVGQFIAPEVRWQSVDRLLADGVAPSVVFSGPRLRHGVIGDDDLRMPPAAIAIEDLMRLIAGVPGVIGVRNIDFRTPLARIGPNGDSTLQVPRRRVLQLETTPADGAFRVHLFVNGTEYTPHPLLVQSELQQLWIAHRRRYPLAAPSGSVRQPRPPAGIGEYHSIQHHFPNVYGINEYGLEADATELRRAQAKQFKGYLLVFEQLLANEFARVGSVHEVFSTAPGLHQSQPYPLDASVPDVKALLKPDYRARLREETQAGDRARERRSRVLDLMLATCGESLVAVAPPDQSHGRGSAALERAQIGAKRTLLRRLPRLGPRRGCGMDYLHPAGGREDSSLEVRSRIQLGMTPSPQPLADELRRVGLILAGSAPSDERAAMLRHARDIDAGFAPIAHVPPASGRARDPRPVSDDLLLAAGAAEHYRMGALPGEDTLIVVCRAPAQPLWQFVGRYDDRDQALADIAALLDAVQHIQPHLRRLTVVEHALLRFGRRRHADEAGLDEAFTATAVVSLPAREAADMAFRGSVRDVLRAHTPAHVVLDVRFLRLSHAAEFEALCADWRKALRQRGRPLIDASRRMREFLHSAAE